MCGIAGILGNGAAPVEASRVGAMAASLKHRGPDGEGTWSSPEDLLVLGHRRLAILDLSPAGAQPMHHSDRFTIVFNGEIYNYLELRAELAARGHRFGSATDTEVLLAAWAEYGEKALELLDGMFAFAIWDSRERKLFCGRDRFGEKPFYWHRTADGTFLFASEMKALFAAGVVARPDGAMLYQYLAHDVVTDPGSPDRTFFSGVKSLPPAHCMRVLPGRAPSVRRYWRIDPFHVDPDVTREAARERFSELLTTSVARRLRSDVPVGSSLSGGIDSSAIVGLIHHLEPNRRRSTFSARFTDPALDEGRWIDIVARATGVEAHAARPDAETLAAEIDRVFHHQEEPFGSASILAQWEVMKLAGRHGVTVLLDGQGADEILGGYPHYLRTLYTELYLEGGRALASERAAYRDVHGREPPVETGLRFRLEARAPGLLRWLGRLRARLTTPHGVRDLHPDFRRAHRSSPPPFRAFRTLNEALAHAAGEEGLARLLRYADRNSMAFSREVRLPFLSHELVEFAFTLPASMKISGGWTKRLLRESLPGILPGEIAKRTDKIGFASPQAEWLAAAPVRDMVESAKKTLLAERILASTSPGREWAYLMAAKLFEFAGSHGHRARARGSPAGLS